MSDSSPATVADDQIQRLVLVFDYRTLMDSDDLDAVNHQAWQEVLDGFGYQNLTFDHFMSTSMVHKSPSEIMKSLCPFTTRAEWTPLLSKRSLRLMKEVEDMCYTQVVPIGGLINFFVDCAHGALVTTILLSPFPDEVTRKLLDRAELSPYIDLVHSYEDRDYALLEALELIDAKPPIIPDNIIEHRWRHQRAEEQSPASGAPILENPSVDGSRRRLSAADVKNLLDHPNIIVFSADPVGCTQATDMGCTAIGVVHNSGFYPAPLPHHHSPPSPNSTKTELVSDPSAAVGRSPIYAAPPPLPTSLNEALLSSGASAVIEDYSNLKCSYLAHYMKKANA